tara:strand:+ start:297 stop:1307 length:1011 start_codon:yes stop_codon:yes gene_type:complete
MKSDLLPKLINNPLGDPGMMVEFLCERRSLQFDLGDLSATSNSDLLKISHVFISHTHIDHFVGFDHLLRIIFGRGKTVHFFGPENFIANIEGKLAGFTWNLVDRYNESVQIEVTEVHSDRLLKARFNAIDQFRKSNEREEPFTNGILVDERKFTVHTAILEHRIPCLGFSIKEKNHLNIRKDQLKEMDYPLGPWLNNLKKCIAEGKPDDYQLQIPVGKNKNQEKPLGQLKEELVSISPGQKISYIVDTVYNESNKRDIVDLVKESDIFFCESPFLAEEETRGLERYHLTSRQAGLLAREANVKKLKVFHFSGRHAHRTEQLIQEAQEAFRGKLNEK